MGAGKISLPDVALSSAGTVDDCRVVVAVLAYWAGPEMGFAADRAGDRGVFGVELGS
jgi:hypothetical protein